MKHCKMCSRVLPLSEFPVRSATTRNPNAYCRECQRAYSRAHYAANKESHNARRCANQKRYSQQNRVKLLEYLRGKCCVDCGESDPIVLDFDHVSGAKDYNIGNMITQATLTRIERELLKCEIRCSNCHRRKTARQFKWFKFKFGV